MADTPWSGDAAQPHNDSATRFANQHADTREKAISELDLIVELPDTTMARSDSAQLIDEMLQEISYGDVA